MQALSFFISNSFDVNLTHSPHYFSKGKKNGRMNVTLELSRSTRAPSCPLLTQWTSLSVLEKQETDERRIDPP